MKIATGLIALGLLATSAAFAHTGVKNPSVKARMDAMKIIGLNTKTIGDMAKGARAFDAATARSAAAAIAEQAARVPALFQAREDDPKSEAKPEIWSSFGDFTARARSLETAAELAASSIDSPDDLAAVIGTLGKSCGGCHQLYTE